MKISFLYGSNHVARFLFYVIHVEYPEWEQICVYVVSFGMKYFFTCLRHIYRIFGENPWILYNHTRSSLEVNWTSLWSFLDKGRFPFPFPDENYVRGRRVANLPGLLEWLAAMKVDRYFLWGINCFSQACKASL